MRAIILALFGALAVNAATLQFYSDSDGVIDYINRVARPGWTAGRNFNDEDLHRFQAISCVNVSANGEYMRKHMPVKDIAVRADLPNEFDAREKWPNCGSLREIRDQGNCGSCWAFATAESITDRICINGLRPVRISSEDILSCCGWCGSGCGGGYPAKAWQYYYETGVVTGGPFDSRKGCLPYEIPPASDANSGAPTPKCEHKCEAGYPKSYTDDKHRGKSYYSVPSVEKAMQEIVDHGPVTAVFQLYTDFYHYKSGVYRHTTGYHTGGHVVKLIGYGTEKGDDYWLVANSWNATWGDNGYFKILRGVDECGIEDWIAGGEPVTGF